MRISPLLTIATASMILTACSKTEDEASTTASAEPTEIAKEAVEQVATQTPSPEETAAAAEKLAADNLETSKAFLAANALKEGVTVLESGLQYEILETGPAGGVSPKEGQVIDIEYSWSHSDGTVFDSSKQRGGDARFPLVPQLGEGIFEGLSLMVPGDRRRFAIPANLAFGKTGTPDGVVQPNEALIFEAKLVNVISAESNLAAATAFLEENGKKDGIKTTDSGLQYKVLTEGDSDGVNPSATDRVRVHYRGTLIDGTEFDSSYARGEPTEFNLDRVVAGWTEGIQLMKAGDKFQFFIPPSLGYGERGTPGGPIGPNEALVFEVELLEIK